MTTDGKTPLTPSEFFQRLDEFLNKLQEQHDTDFEIAILIQNGDDTLSISNFETDEEMAGFLIASAQAVTSGEGVEIPGGSNEN